MLNLKKLFLFLLLFVNYTIISEGFIAGTLVKTKNGYVPIEQLKENDYVTSYSFKNKELYECKILKVKKQHYDKSIKIRANGNEIICASDHKFYLPLHSNKKWVVASDLKPKDSILRNIKELIQIDEVNELGGSDFYSLSIDKYHNFFVTPQDILVHNFAFTVPVFTWIIGEGIAWAGLGTWFGALAAVLIDKFAKENDIDCTGLTEIGDVRVSFNNDDPNKYRHVMNNPEHGFHSDFNSGGPDPDEWWKRIKETLKKANRNPERFSDREATDIETHWKSNDPNYGNLVVKVFKVKGMMELSTAFLKKFIR